MKNPFSCGKRESPQTRARTLFGTLRKTNHVKSNVKKRETKAVLSTTMKSSNVMKNSASSMAMKTFQTAMSSTKNSRTVMSSMKNAPSVGMKRSPSRGKSPRDKSDASASKNKSPSQGKATKRSMSAKRPSSPEAMKRRGSSPEAMKRRGSSPEAMKRRGLKKTPRSPGDYYSKVLAYMVLSPKAKRKKGLLSSKIVWPSSSRNSSTGNSSSSSSSKSRPKNVNFPIKTLLMASEEPLFYSSSATATLLEKQLCNSFDSEIRISNLLSLLKNIESNKTYKTFPNAASVWDSIRHQNGNDKIPEARLDIMRGILRAKFHPEKYNASAEADYEFKSILLSTGNRELIYVVEEYELEEFELVEGELEGSDESNKNRKTMSAKTTAMATAMKNMKAIKIAKSLDMESNITPFWGTIPLKSNLDEEGQNAMQKHHKYRGHNYHGQLLMEIRAELQKELFQIREELLRK